MHDLHIVLGSYVVLTHFWVSTGPGDTFCTYASVRRLHNAPETSIEAPGAALALPHLQHAFVSSMHTFSRNSLASCTPVARIQLLQTLYDVT